MCPSYMVTREEKHSTRGRARLLFEMLRGEVITDGWQSKEVYEALDLCLACKGCTNDCPVNVDMPTYKAEFLYHHYKSPRRWRPRYAYAFGLIDQAARIGSRMPGAGQLRHPEARRCGGSPSSPPGWTAGREIPTFAPITLQEWFRRRGAVNPDGPRVILFPDTFNNHFHTDVGVACVEALEAAGWQVVMPEGHVCCGRPLYDYGFLDLAERYLHGVLDTFRDEIRQGTPIVGMEPSCLAVFKDELTNLLPHDDDAERLRRCSYHWSEFFEEHDDRGAEGGQAGAALGPLPPQGDRRHRSRGAEAAGADGPRGRAGPRRLLRPRRLMGLRAGQARDLDGLRRAGPAARRPGGADETVVVANGFSCKTQIEQAGIGRRALHAAQVMKLAREHGPDRLDAREARGPYYEVARAAGLVEAQARGRARRRKRRRAGGRRRRPAALIARR